MADEKRFGISALSKSRIADAYKEEIMVDKATGEFLVKTPEGDTVSYNHTLRVDNALELLKKNSENNSLYGDIYQLTLDDVVFPVTTTADTNLLTTTQTITDEMSSFMINVDVSCLTINPDGFTTENNDCKVVVEYNVSYSDGTTSNNTVATMLKSDLDNARIYLPSVNTITGLNLIDIHVTNDVYDHGTSSIVTRTNLRHIVHSIHVIVG